MKGEITIFILKALPAYDGDCFLISFGEGSDVRNIIVDGGRGRLVVKKLKNEIEEIKAKGQVIDLMILTHLDNDHIFGLIKLFEDASFDHKIIKEVWFNSKELIAKNLFNEVAQDNSIKIFDKTNGNISYKQGLTFSERLEKLGVKNDKLITRGHSMSLGEAKLKVLSPNESQLRKMYSKWDKAFPNKVEAGIKISGKRESDYAYSIDELLTRPFKEDTDIVNGSSIAFLLEYKSKRLLMLADAHPSTIISGLKDINQNQGRIVIDLVKLSHHGSKGNTNKELVELIDCKNYLISTNGHTHGLPNKETIVKIVKNNPNKLNFYFNYPNVFNEVLTKDEILKLNISCLDIKKNEILVVDLWRYSEPLE